MQLPSAGITSLYGNDRESSAEGGSLLPVAKSILAGATLTEAVTSLLAI